MLEVVELGWAEFKVGRYESAKAHTLKALTRAPDNDRRGMLHYNLGRIAEAQDQTEVAVAAYELSLALRPNDVVAGRLDNLTHAVDAAGDDVDRACLANVVAQLAVHHANTQQ